MEVGAVKQAFNNEVIHLKQKLNQARIQVIHKLTRKAKTLVEKKAPEQLKEKLKRKAESAVKEVLILKKIKPKDLAKFTVTHTGDLKKYLNCPNIDMDKACARLLLHKALQDKYTHIRNKYSNVPIDDLLMSRLERRKLKKEEKDKQKNKKKENQNRSKNNSISSEGDWTVEDVKADGKSNLHVKNKNDDDQVNDKDDLSDESELTEENDNENESEIEKTDDDDDVKPKTIDDDAPKFSPGEEHANDDQTDDEAIPAKSSEEDDDNANFSDNSDDDVESDQNEINHNSNLPAEMPLIKVQGITKIIKTKKEIYKKPPKDDNRAKLPKINKDKNKKQLEKITSKKLKKDIDETIPESNMVVDPFFITSSGDRYMSMAEPRAPDEVKEFHQQGNRKIRRAAMFGHELKFRPRPYNDRRQNNGEFNKNERFNNPGNFDRNKNNFNRNERSNFDRRNNNFKGNDKFDRQSNSADFNNKTKFNSSDKKADFKRNNFNKDFKEEKSAVPEKLHPSWEAKKKISSILPYQGKKITFD